MESQSDAAAMPLRTTIYDESGSVLFQRVWGAAEVLAECYRDDRVWFLSQNLYNFASSLGGDGSEKDVVRVIFDTHPHPLRHSLRKSELDIGMNAPLQAFNRAVLAAFVEECGPPLLASRTAIAHSPEQKDTLLEQLRGELRDRFDDIIERIRHDFFLARTTISLSPLSPPPSSIARLPGTLSRAGASPTPVAARANCSAELRHATPSQPHSSPTSSLSSSAVSPLVTSASASGPTNLRIAAARDGERAETDFFPRACSVGPPVPPMFAPPPPLLPPPLPGVSQQERRGDSGAAATALGAMEARVTSGSAATTVR